jgi:hypothetical protein
MLDELFSSLTTNAWRRSTFAFAKTTQANVPLHTTLQREYA